VGDSGTDLVGEERIGFGGICEFTLPSSISTTLLIVGLSILWKGLNTPLPTTVILFTISFFFSWLSTRQVSNLLPSLACYRPNMGSISHLCESLPRQYSFSLPPFLVASFHSYKYGYQIFE